MKAKLHVLILLIFFSFGAQAQVDTLVKKLDSLQVKTDSAGGQVNNIADSAYNDQTRITFPTYFALLGSTLKQEFTAPFHWKGGDWKKIWNDSCGNGHTYADR